uniref:DUF3082 domain-containing protein n=1 Tax=Desertifilum tharense IPPAS B-1220 TaxID=1781255 RepID=A0ACD5GUF0_9CYAN
MSDPNLSPQPQSPQKATPLRCLTGAVISGAIATALYWLTGSIVQTFANKPIHSDNPLTINLAVAVRTLVIGMGFLGTGIFAVATLGLVALAIQLLIQRPSATD